MKKKKRKSSGPKKTHSTKRLTGESKWKYKAGSNKYYLRGEAKGKYYRERRIGTVKSIKKDSKIIAKLPGKRISASGKVYYENRKNRSDSPKGDV